MPRIANVKVCVDYFDDLEDYRNNKTVIKSDVIYDGSSNEDAMNAYNESADEDRIPDSVLPGRWTTMDITTVAD